MLFHFSQLLPPTAFNMNLLSLPMAVQGEAKKSQLFLSHGPFIYNPTTHTAPKGLECVAHHQAFVY